MSDTPDIVEAAIEWADSIRSSQTMEGVHLINLVAEVTHVREEVVRLRSLLTTERGRVVEECAKVADAKSDEAISRSGNTTIQIVERAWSVWTAKDISKSIRSLSSAEGGSLAEDGSAKNINTERK